MQLSSAPPIVHRKRGEWLTIHSSAYRVFDLGPCCMEREAALGLLIKIESCLSMAVKKLFKKNMKEDIISTESGLIVMLQEGSCCTNSLRFFSASVLGCSKWM